MAALALSAAGGQFAKADGQRKSRRSTGRLRIDRRPVSGEKGPAQGRERAAPDWGLATPEGLVRLELDFARAEAKVTQRAMVEVRELVPLAGATAPGRQDLVERREGAGQRRLGRVMKREVGHGMSPWKDVEL